jgi:hypothetical protein
LDEWSASSAWMSPSSISCELSLFSLPIQKKIDAAKQTPHKFAFLVARKPLKLFFLTLVVIVVVQLF